ncbi:MAG: biopolymer transporter ExbD [Planctomycetes bacterium]|nr:biopolymer transporter ExbD [Planctomycetota bacterium]
MKLTKQDNEPEPLEIEMTPMIDVVFLLIVFFMIVVDLTQQEIVLLQLPTAVHAIPDKKPEQNRLTVNVTWDKREQQAAIRIKRTEMTLDELKAWMYPIARSKIDAKTKFSEIPILIRCDQDAPFRVVQQIMAVCADKDIQIYKVMLAAAEPKPDNK